MAVFKFVLYCATLLTIAGLCSCAHQIPPGGGPIDSGPPVVKEVFPADGTLRVGKKQTLTITFSEWVDPRSAQVAITVFPRPDNGITIAVHGKTIDVRPATVFAESTTYQLEVGSSLRDLHGNAFKTPLHVVFSTGNEFDKGKISGCVFGAGRGSAQPKVALFTVNDTVQNDTALFDVPRYMVQCDSNGTFAFSAVRPVRYNVVGFIDASNNSRLDPGKEQTFAPIVPIVNVDTLGQTIQLFSISSDTVPQRLATIKTMGHSILIGEWLFANRPTTPFSPLWKIVSTSEGKPAAISACIPLRDSKRFALRLGPGPGAQTCYLVYPKPISYHYGESNTDTLRFNGTALADTIIPKLIVAGPSGTTNFLPRIKLIWSEPVRFADSVWTLTDSLKTKITITTDTLFGDTTIFTLPYKLPPQGRYTCVIPKSLFKDLNGNTPADTDTVKIVFRTQSMDAMCLSLSGSVSCLPKEVKRIWMFQSIEGFKNPISTIEHEGTFRFDTLEACKGKLSYFIDVNDDGKLTPGSLVPWSAPEPRFSFPDTVEARRGWDVEGVEVSGACKVCP